MQVTELIYCLFPVLQVKQNFSFMYTTWLISPIFSLQRQLETLGAQRAGLEDMLKEMKRKVKLIVCAMYFLHSFLIIYHLNHCARHSVSLFFI